VKVVVVMPFDGAFDEVYATMKRSVESIPDRDLICLRVDEDLQARRITGKIEDHIRSADICIADITGLRANVLWEVGYIEALQKPLIAVSQTKDPLPFNIGDIAVIYYNRSHLQESLARPLIQAIQQTLSTYVARRSKWTIAITGSRGLSPNKAAYTVSALASRFLGPDATWYCGTNGAVDYAAASFLLEAKENVYGVFSSTHQLADDVRALFHQHGRQIINADNVSLPRQLPDLSWRDAFFVTKADLVILVWDGASVNIGRMHEWLTAHHKDHLLTFAS
jgi:hypothetical protein